MCPGSTPGLRSDLREQRCSILRAGFLGSMTWVYMRQDLGVHHGLVHGLSPITFHVLSASSVSPGIAFRFFFLPFLLLLFLALPPPFYSSSFFFLLLFFLPSSFFPKAKYWEKQIPHTVTMTTAGNAAVPSDQNHQFFPAMMTVASRGHGKMPIADFG